MSGIWWCSVLFACVRFVWGLVRADHPDSQQLPPREGDPQHAERASGSALRWPGRGIQPRCLAPARLAASAQLQVRLLEEADYEGKDVETVAVQGTMCNSFVVGRGTKLTERSRTSSSRWFRNAGDLERKSMTSCRPSSMPPTSKTPSVMVDIHQRESPKCLTRQTFY